MDIRYQKKLFMHKVQMMMLKILIIFGAPAGIAFAVGNWLDKTYFEKPNGSLLALGVAFILSWSIIITTYSKLEKERIELETKEEEEEEKTKQQK